MTVDHCGLPMMTVHSRTGREDRFEMALTVELVDTLYLCEHCGAKLATHLEQPATDQVNETCHPGGDA